MFQTGSTSWCNLYPIVGQSRFGTLLVEDESHGNNSVSVTSKILGDNHVDTITITVVINGQKASHCYPATVADNSSGVSQSTTATSYAGVPSTLFNSANQKPRLWPGPPFVPFSPLLRFARLANVAPEPDTLVEVTIQSTTTRTRSGSSLDTLAKVRAQSPTSTHSLFVHNTQEPLYAPKSSNIPRPTAPTGWNSVLNASVDWLTFALLYPLVTLVPSA